jgi:hypothetical protein
VASNSGGKHFTNPPYGSTLFCANGKKFETVTQPVTITHERAQLDRIRRHGQRKLQGHDFTDLQFSSERCANAVFSNFA